MCNLKQTVYFDMTNKTKPHNKLTSSSRHRKTKSQMQDHIKIPHHNMPMQHIWGGGEVAIRVSTLSKP
jgi:hypothetical protein